MLQLKRIDIPPEYFLDRVHRDFISGRIVLEAVDPYYDFDFVDLAKQTSVSGLAAGNFFHFTEMAYPRVKKLLSQEGINVRA